MNRFTWLVYNPQSRSYNSLRRSQPPAKYSTIIQSNSCDQKGNYPSLVALWAGFADHGGWCHSIEQWAQVIKVISNLQWSLTDHPNYYPYICIMHLLHYSYLQVLEFNYNLINEFNNVQFKVLFHFNIFSLL